MKLRWLIVIFFLFLKGGFIQCQDLSQLKYSWDTVMPFTEIPENFSHEDVVMVNQEMTLSNWYDYNSSRLFSNLETLQRFHIQNKNAIQDISNYTISFWPGTFPLIIDARTIKKNGEVILLNRDDIKRIRQFYKQTGVYFDQYRLSLPGLEVGDDVEIVYLFQSHQLTLNKDIYLNTDFPTLNSTFTYQTTKQIASSIFARNGMPNGENKGDYNKQSYTWTLSNLKPIKYQPWSIPDNEFPFIRIRVDFANLSGVIINYHERLNSWEEMYDQIIKSAYNKGAKKKGMKNYFWYLQEQLQNLSIMEKVTFFVNMINADFKISDELDKKSRNLPLFELMLNKEMDHVNLIYFYRMMFFHLNIPCYTVLARNRYNGELDYSDISTEQIDAVFFTFNDESGIMHYLVPSNSRIKYYIDEVPFNFEDTKAVFLQKDNPYKNKHVIATERNINHISPALNIMSLNSHYLVLENGDVQVTTKGNNSGIISSYCRDELEEFIKNYNKKDLMEWLGDTNSSTIILDTIMKEECLTVPPYNFRYRYKSTIKDAVSTTGNNLRSLRIQPSPGHTIPAYTKYERSTTAFLPFKFTNDIELFIEFPQPVSILNEQDLTKSIENETGYYHLTFLKISPTVYKIISTYNNKMNVIPKEKYTKLIELNEAAEEFNELNLVYKID